MKMLHKGILSTLLMTSFFHRGFGQGVKEIPVSSTHYSQQVEEKIAAFENLVSVNQFVVEGKTGPLILDRMLHYGIKGISIAVINNYQLEWAKAYGWADEEEKRPLGTETLFEPGSISKSLNALAVLRQVQENKLDLDKDINEYLHSWKFPYTFDPQKNKITLRHLLSHTAGLNMHGFPGYAVTDALPSIVQILDGLAPANTEAVRSLFKPGVKYEYSGGGTMISQLILMDLMGKPYDQILQETVLNPLGMTGSFFTQPAPASKAALLATGYTTNGQAVTGKYPVLAEQAAGGLWTNPTELSRFVIEMQQSLQGKSNKILSKEMTVAMTTPYKNKISGLGVFIDDFSGVKYFQHSAGNRGFSGKYYGSMDGGYGAVIFINADYGVEIMDEILSAIAKVYQWPGIPNTGKPEAKKAIQLQDNVLESYTGVYREKHTITVISKKDKTLFYQTMGSCFEMYFESTTDFFNTESVSVKKMILDAKGKVLGFDRIVKGKVLGRSVKIEPFVLAADVANQYTGKYMGDQGVIAEIKKIDQDLWMETEGQLKRLYFLEKNVFVTAEDGGVNYELAMDKKGFPIALVVKMGKNSMRLNKSTK